MFIDCHTHAFADKIADKAVAQLVGYYNIRTNHGGRLADLLSAATAARLDALILLVAATRSAQVRPANTWAIGLVNGARDRLGKGSGTIGIPEIIPFGTFHPGDPDWLRELGRLRAAGIKGIKLHPEFQGIDLGGPALDDFWAEVERDFVVLVHVGDPVKSAGNPSTPAKVAAILDRFPKLRLIAAHLGGYQFWQEAFETLAGREVYLDTSSTLPYLHTSMLRRIIAKHGTERILFGSDYPLRSPAQEWRLLEQIPWLTAAEKDNIRGANCARLLGL